MVSIMGNGAACAVGGVRDKPRQFDVPSERTFRRVLKVVHCDSLKEALVGWMRHEDPRPLERVHLDGKVKRTPSRRPLGIESPSQRNRARFPPSSRSPKADKALMLVNFMTSDQRLQCREMGIADSRRYRSGHQRRGRSGPLAEDGLGGSVTADAAHTTKNN
jgi:hypothetical protein